MEVIFVLGLAIGAIIVVGLMEFIFRYFAWKDKKDDDKNKKR